MNFFLAAIFIGVAICLILLGVAICFILLAKESKYYRIIGWLTILFFIISLIIIILYLRYSNASINPVERIFGTIPLTIVVWIEWSFLISIISLIRSIIKKERNNIIIFSIFTTFILFLTWFALQFQIAMIRSIKPQRATTNTNMDQIQTNITDKQDGLVEPDKTTD